MMTKKLASLALALVMCLSLCVPALAVNVEPQNNRYQTVVETDPYWTFANYFVVTNQQARDRTTLANAISIGLGAAGFYPPTSVLAYIASISVALGNMADPYGEWGYYTVSKKNRTTYREDRITGERSIISRDLLIRTVLDHPEEQCIKEFTLNLK